MASTLHTLDRTYLSVFIATILLLSACKSGADKKFTMEDEYVMTRQVDSTEFRLLHGKSLFVQYCNHCHVSPDATTTDQWTFIHLFERLPDPAEAYFIKFISNSKLLLDAGDPYVSDLYRSYNSDYNHVFGDSMSVADINDLMTFIKSNN